MLGKAVRVVLQQAGYAVDWVMSGEDAEEHLAQTEYDLMVLDINLPGMSGLQLLQALRSRRQQLPVVALTARDTTSQRVEGLDAGADDYLVKPFDIDELLARLRALGRRAQGRVNPVIIHGNITLDPAAKTVQQKGHPVAVSAREFAVLLVLLENVGRVMSKDQIVEKLYDWDTEVESNTVEVHVSHLRKKLGNNVIKTIRGLGYIVEKIA